MPGFETQVPTPGSSVSTVFADNVDFSGGSPVVGKVTTDGQLLIGASTSPNIRVGTLTGTGGITVTPGPGTIQISLTGGGTAIDTITGNDGTPQSPDGSGNFNLITGNATVKFLGTTNTETLDFGLSNLILGSSGSSITSAVANVGLGNTALSSVTSGGANTCIGTSCGDAITSGNNNVFVGSGTGGSNTQGSESVGVGTGTLSSFTTGGANLGRNTAIGHAVFPSLATGRFNVGIGFGSGTTYTGAETSNTLLNNDGVLGESNTMRLGTSGTNASQNNRTFVSGITGVTVASSAPIAVDTNGQISSLGFGSSTQVLTSNGAGNSPTWQANASGDVVGPAGATSTAIAVYNGATGKIIANSIPTIDSSGNILTSASLSGSTLSIDVVNSSNTANSVARLSTTVAGTSAGDALFQANLSGGQSWTFGLDNSDSDAFALSSNVALGTTNVMRVSTAGEINYPLQPAFLAYLASTDNNVTGDGTVFRVGSTTALTEVFDQNSDFNTNGTFTAPVDGKYHFSAMGLVTGGTSIGALTSNWSIITGNRTYLKNARTGGSTLSIEQISVLADMDAGDTATWNVSLTDSGGKVDDLIGSATLSTYFSGYLAC